MSKNKDKHQSKLDTLCQLPPDIPAIKAYLKELNAQAQHVAANSNDYPKQTISADVWRDGYQIVNTARALAEWLEQQRLYELLPQAVECWGTAAFAVVSHYRAEIGPFMHAAMWLQKRRGNSQAVQEMCRAPYWATSPSCWKMPKTCSPTAAPTRPIIRKTANWPPSPTSTSPPAFSPNTATAKPKPSANASNACRNIGQP